jgi:hypothetical protein
VKYAYVVTRATKDQPEHMMSIPNLGVHSSFISANSHFNSVIKQRRDFATVVWDHKGTDSEMLRDPCLLLREAFVRHRDNSTENLRLERWKMGKKKCE